MTPYFDDGQITIYHADCLEHRAWLAADVLVTDPPYGLGQAYGRRNLNSTPWAPVTPRTIANDADTDARDAVLALWGQGPAAVFGSPRLPDPPGIWADRLVWNKKRPGMNGGPWRYQHETIYVTPGFVRVSDAATSVIEAFPADQELHIHAKPVEVMVRIVEAAPDGVITDPFMGSGSTLVAAKRLGRRAVGVELDESYCEIAVQRLAQGVLAFDMEAAET